MGDLSAKLQDVFKRVETAINKGLGRAEGYNSGTFDVTEKGHVSLFAQDIVQDAVNKGDITESEAKEIFGLVLSPQAQEAAAARRAPGTGDGGDGDGNGDGDGTGGTGGTGNGDIIIDKTDGGVHITINNSSSWSLTINISVGDAANIEALLNAFLKGVENITQNMLDQLIEFLTKSNDNVFQLLNQLFTLLADNNNLQIKTLQDILAALNQLGIKIDGATEVIAKLLQAQLEALEDSNFKMDTLVNLVKENNESQEKQNEILTMIFDAIGKFADSFGNFSNEIVAQFNTLFAMLENNGTSYETMIALLKKIQEDTSEGNNISKQILAAMNKIDAHFTEDGDITALLKQIASKELSVTLEGADVNVSIDIDAILEKLDTIINNTNDNKEYQKKILEAINKYGGEVTSSLTTIIENMGKDSTKIDNLLAFLQTMDEHNTENTNKLLEAIANIELNVVVDNLKVDIDVQGIIDAILNSTGDINAKMDEITELLNSINNNIIKGNEQNEELINIANDILAEVKTLGFTVSGGIAVLIEKADGNKEALESILAFLKTMDANAETRNKAVLEAIAKVGIDVIDALKNLDIDVNVDGRWQEVIDAINGNTEAVVLEGNNTNAWLQDIFTLITTLNNKIGPGGGGDTNITCGVTKEELQEIINNMITNIVAALHGAFEGDIVDLMNKLDEILAAIKDHKVNVVVTYDNNTGDCNVTTNEGENNGVGALLSRAFTPDFGSDASGIENLTTDGTENNQAKVKNGKKVALNNQYGLKGLYVVEDNGDGTVNVYSLKGALVRDHVRKE